MENSHDVCSICLDPVDAVSTSKSGDGEAYKTTCNHKFHRGCLANWLQHGNCCPLCKRTMEQTDVLRILGPSRTASGLCEQRVTGSFTLISDSPFRVVYVLQPTIENTGQVQGEPPETENQQVVPQLGPGPAHQRQTGRSWLLRNGELTISPVSQPLDLSLQTSNGEAASGNSSFATVEISQVEPLDLSSRATTNIIAQTGSTLEERQLVSPQPVDVSAQSRNETISQLELQRQPPPIRQILLLDVANQNVQIFAETYC